MHIVTRQDGIGNTQAQEPKTPSPAGRSPRANQQPTQHKENRIMIEKRSLANRYTTIEEETLHEPMRPRSNRRSSARHQSECACGRPGALVREGRRWKRLPYCWHCGIGRMFVPAGLANEGEEYEPANASARARRRAA